MPEPIVPAAIQDPAAPVVPAVTPAAPVVPAVPAAAPAAPIADPKAPVVPAAAKSLLDQASDEAKAAEKAKLDAEAAKAPIVPEKYEVKVPEGMTVDDVLITAVTPIAKDLKLSNEAVQKLADVYAGRMKEVHEQQVRDSQAAAKAEQDETIKGLGANHAVEMASAAKFRDRAFSPATIDRINKSGLGNNLAFIQDCIKLGKMISEQPLVEGGKGPGEGSSAADVMFPTMSKKS